MWQYPQVFFPLSGTILFRGRDWRAGKRLDIGSSERHSLIEDEQLVAPRALAQTRRTRRRPSSTIARKSHSDGRTT